MTKVCSKSNDYEIQRGNVSILKSSNNYETAKLHVQSTTKMTVLMPATDMNGSNIENLHSKYDSVVLSNASNNLSHFGKSSHVANGTMKHFASDSLKMQTTKSDEDHHPADISKGLLNIRAIIFLTLWYFFSFTTLFMNKYILAYRHGDPTVLGIVQMLSCAVCGYLHLCFPCGLYKKVHQQSRKTFRSILRTSLVGSLRFSTVILGLIALWYVPVSFAETVKSSAPVFTVVIARIVLGDRTSFVVTLSLIPVMGGLALCSANELSFNTLGFIAAMATNLSECFQNVYSKMLLSGEKNKFSPPELQCYSSLASIGVQIPVSIVLVNFSRVWAHLDREMILILLAGGLSFHFQSIMEYTLLGYISPVTHSVANTTKRALLIWLSVLIFGNKVTFLSGLGTMIVIVGVVFYNKAQEWTYRPPIPSVPDFSVGAKEGVHAV